MGPEQLIKLVNAVRKELRSNRESLIYFELEIFVGCVLLECHRTGLISTEDEKILRKLILK